MERVWENIEQDACGIGTIVNIDGHADHRVLDDALKIVEKLDHRAGHDASGKVGDGVGILTQISHHFFSKECKKIGIKLKDERCYGVGMFFLPQDSLACTFAKRMFEVIAKKNGLEILGWRDVPVNPEILGDRAVECMPSIQQVFIDKPKDCKKGIDFDRKLYITRREFEQGSEDTYICSLSSRTIVYKGMFLVNQLRAFYDDMRDSDYETAIAIVHSRFSTNTTPSWQRAHPYRFIAHNGEINTIRGNADRMLAREETMSSELLKDDLDKIYPVINASGSDSAMVDNTLEFLYYSGMDLPLALMLMVPEPFKHNQAMESSRRDFYHYYATMMEPWDGPAAMIFSDGDVVGATLDRNGLRPSRYYVTDDGRLILASEVGVLDIPSEHIIKKSRLMPGKMLLVDTKQKRILSDEEVKQKYAESQPYGEWLDMNLLHLSDIKIPNKKVHEYSQIERDKLYKVFGYTYEEVKNGILPMAANGVEPTASMGRDIPLAVLNDKPSSLFDYFHQQFAQVTNPPIDSIREKVVTDTTVYIGSDGNLLKESGENCRVLEVNNPILTSLDLMKIRTINKPGFHTEDISLLYYKHTSLKKALDALCVACDRAYNNGSNILILTDRGIDENHVAIPSLLAVSAVETHLVNTKKRTQVSLIIETGEARDVHQCAALLGFGARAINPYLAQDCVVELIEKGMLNKDYHSAIDDYNEALLSGIVKTAAKMGISCLQSYQSSKIFEAIGLDKDFVQTYFPGISWKVGGCTIETIENFVIKNHDKSFDSLGLGVDTTLDSTGYHSLRSNDQANEHLYSPDVIVALQKAVRDGSYEEFKEYTSLLHAKNPHTLRDKLEFDPQNSSIPLEEVEPVENIVKRFKTGAMSYGSISKEAHETMAIAMNTLGGKSNTGEGGEDASRFGTIKNSAIKQVASGRFGVTSAYLNSAQEIQIKMAQGAKPGEGGHLPGVKVYPWVAKTRFSTPGVSLISPPPHHDIYSIEDLAQLIYDLKNANHNARISVKLVSEAGVGTVASGVAKAGAQVILISGFDGGTGAAPGSSIHHAGMPWELGISEAQQALIENGLREKVIIETDGKLMSGRDVAIACLLGAEEFGFATGPLVSMGCMMMRVCSLDTCPFGVATQNEELRKRFKGKPEHVMNFMKFIAEELREIMAELGFHTIDEMVGRNDCLKVQDNTNVHLSRLVHTDVANAEYRHFVNGESFDFHLDQTIDSKELIPSFTPYIDKKKPFKYSIHVSSENRTTGTLLGSLITEKCGDSLKEDTYVVECLGGGGQSFGAFIPKGMSLYLKGDANDHVGKGLSGGKIVVTPDDKSKYDPSENIIVGNVALYGATSGKAYFEGVAGERFCVRNSGAEAVVEGCGDHGLEYMTGGKVVILGKVGKNFAAGMSGGIAYVLDTDHDLYKKLNKSLVTLQEVTDKYDKQQLKEMIQDYYQETHSPKAKKILSDFDERAKEFKKIVPSDYAKMLTAISHFEEQGIAHDKAEFEAFQLMKRGA
jgi:glutamate synthase (NADPH) large chain